MWSVIHSLWGVVDGFGLPAGRAKKKSTLLLFLRKIPTQKAETETEEEEEEEEKMEETKLCGERYTTSQCLIIIVMFNVFL